ncbi:MAG: hypothetical protein QM731_03145 [Chitinophagaceae bacterium]
MKKTILFKTAFILLLTQQAYTQTCKTNAELDVVSGKYLTADQYPWPAARAEYFNNMATPADKSMAKQTLSLIEKTEQQSRTGFTLTGGDWENTYSTEGYTYSGTTRLGKYTFQSALHEYFCLSGKLKRNDESITTLRAYVNTIPVNTLERFLQYPFGSSLGDYDFGLQYMDWKNHKPSDVQAPLISLFNYFSCNNETLLEAINSGNSYFQDVPEQQIRPNNRSTYVYRYWFVKKKNLPVLVPVSRKEYLQSLLEYYEREKLHFPRLIAYLNKEHDKGVTRYSSWEADVADKIAVVKKALSEHDEEWLAAQAVINRMGDQSQSYKAKLTERTNYNRFWQFYDNDKKGEALFKYNPEYFKTSTQGAARPQIISFAFRYVPVPSSLRILNNFTQHFDFAAIKKMLE